MKKDLTSLSDEKLVGLYKSGLNEAFAVLLNRHKDRIYNYISFVTKNESLTDDIFQETFIKAVVCLQKGTYSENGKFGAWLSRIAHNLLIDHYRRTNYENTLSNDEAEYDIFNDMKLCEESIEDDLIREQQLKDVVALLDFLPDNQREVVYLRFYENLSFNEIAEQTGVSINTALGRMRYALINLKSMAKERVLV
ncbi:MAG: sigma-70 family RNA polymerase sigma factor [Paludibacteraceae bacterium]|jgi:RNA polymerase sigma-70 factor (ECF subfamily)|nr:sigma-70 family RNA polymerase sigma factor [Paludibacteraceae bacterium]